MSNNTLATTELSAVPYELVLLEDGVYSTSVDHDGHDDGSDDCQECEDALRSIQDSLPTGWKAEWTGDGCGTESDVRITYCGIEAACA